MNRLDDVRRLRHSHIVSGGSQSQWGRWNEMFIQQHIGLIKNALRRLGFTDRIAREIIKSHDYFEQVIQFRNVFGVWCDLSGMPVKARSRWERFFLRNLSNREICALAVKHAAKCAQSVIFKADPETGQIPRIHHAYPYSMHNIHDCFSDIPSKRLYLLQSRWVYTGNDRISRASLRDHIEVLTSGRTAKPEQCELFYNGAKMLVDEILEFNPRARVGVDHVSINASSSFYRTRSQGGKMGWLPKESYPDVFWNISSFDEETGGWLSTAIGEPPPDKELDYQDYRLLIDFARENPVVQQSIVAEPGMKARVITKGTLATNVGLQSLHHMMSGFLSGHPSLAMGLSRAVHVRGFHNLDMSPEEGGEGQEKPMWLLSADLKNATDFYPWNLAYAILSGMADQMLERGVLSREQYEYIIQASHYLTSKRLLFDPTGTVSHETRNGVLMGEPGSKIALTAMMAVSEILARQKSGTMSRKWEVVGDDLLAVGTKDHLRWLYHFIGVGGVHSDKSVLSSSHGTFVEQIVLKVHTKRGPILKQLDVLKVRLVSPFVKGSTGESIQANPVPGKLNALNKALIFQSVRAGLSSVTEDIGLDQYFLRYFKETFRGMFPRGMFFVAPQNIGGLGLASPEIFFKGRSGEAKADRIFPEILGKDPPEIKDPRREFLESEWEATRAVFKKAWMLLSADEEGSLALNELKLQLSFIHRRMKPQDYSIDRSSKIYIVGEEEGIRIVENHELKQLEGALWATYEKPKDLSFPIWRNAMHSNGFVSVSDIVKITSRREFKEGARFGDELTYRQKIDKFQTWFETTYPGTEEISLLEFMVWRNNVPLSGISWFDGLPPLWTLRENVQGMREAMSAPVAALEEAYPMDNWAWM